MFPWGTKSPLVEKCSCRNIQPKSAICKTSHFENLPKRMFLHWHISISILNLQLKKTAPGGPASRELQQRPAPNSQQHIKRHSPTAQQIHLNDSPCQAGSHLLGSQNLTLLLGSTRKTILNITDFLAFHLQSLTH